VYDPSCKRYTPEPVRFSRRGLTAPDHLSSVSLWDFAGADGPRPSLPEAFEGGRVSTDEARLQAPFELEAGLQRLDRPLGRGPGVRANPSPAVHGATPLGSKGVAAARRPRTRA